MVSFPGYQLVKIVSEWFRIGMQALTSLKPAIGDASDRPGCDDLEWAFEVYR